jgi:cation diffusion facilitator CzcD-associated flavoprotein CzcO
MVSAATAKVQKVGIIGAGVAGIQVAAHLQHAGISVKLFDKSEEVGGVWRKNYSGYGLQVSWMSLTIHIYVHSELR